MCEQAYRPREGRGTCGGCQNGGRAGRRLRHPYDKRLYVLPAFVLLCSLVAAVAAFCAAGSLRPEVASGSLAPADDVVRAVEDATYDGGRGTLSFEVLLEPGREYTLAVARSGAAPFHAAADGNPLARESGRLGCLRQVSAYAVPPAPDDAPRTVCFEIAVSGWGGSDGAYIGTRDAVYDSFYLLERGMEVCAVTMLSVMAFYALSLFFAKRSETYLIPFVAYAVFLVVWIALVNTDWFNDLSAPVLNYARMCVHFYVAYVPSAICVLLSGVEPPSALKPFLRWYGLLCVPALFAAVAYAVGLGPVMTVATLLCLAVAGWALVRGAALGHPGVLVLVAGFGITMGCKLGATLVDVGVIDDCALVYALRKARLLNVPVVLSIMLYLNQTFARNFRRTEETNALLETMVERRTEGLVEQQRMRLGMMVNIFHDLRGPLFAIERCADALAEGDPGQRERSLEVLRDRVSFLGRLVDDLFTAAKLEDGECLLAEDPVDLGAELPHVVDACAPLARERGVGIGLDLGEAPGDSGGQGGVPLTTWGDRRYLARAFENLVTNAIQHAPSGTCVLVSAGHEAAAPGGGEGRWLRVVVHNEGDPIEPEAIGKVFDRYYQRNTKAPNGSSGIGLSIVRSVVERHHGTVGVKSGTEGTDFEVRLPHFDPSAG